MHNAPGDGDALVREALHDLTDLCVCVCVFFYFLVGLVCGMGEI